MSLDIYEDDELQSVNVSSVNNKIQVNAGKPQNYYDGLAKQWAISENIVDSIDYSSKHYAEESKKQADVATEQATIATNKVDEVIESGNEALTNISTAKENSIANIQNQETSSKNLIISTAEEQIEAVGDKIEEIETTAQEEINKIKQAGFFMEDDKLFYTDSKGEQKEFKATAMAFIPGFLYKSTGWIDESENIFRYPNGQVIAEDDSIKGLTAFLDKQEKLGNTSIFCTETEWQAIKSASKFGQCGKYVRDKVAGTVRLPLIINEQGLNDLASCGVIKAESLPNITGGFKTWGSEANIDGTFGAFYTDNVGASTNQTARESGNMSGAGHGRFSASHSSSTYQDNAPVQQEAIQYPYVICVNSGVEEAERPINNYQVNNVYSYGMSQYYKGEMDNLSWLRSEGQENSGTIYKGVYEWILQNVNKGADDFKQNTGYCYKDTGITGYYWWIATTNPVVGMTVYVDKQGIKMGSGVITTVTDSDNFTYLDSSGVTYNVTRYATEDRSGENWISDYDWVIDTANQTFRLPLLDGSEDLLGDRYEDFTLPATGSIYVAPANGRISIAKVSGAENVFLDLINSTRALVTEEITPMNWNTLMQNIEVRRGDNVAIYYTATGTTQTCRFIYATGNGSLYYYVGDTLQNPDLINIARQQEQIVNLQSNKVSKSGDTMTGQLIIDTVAKTSIDSTIPLVLIQQAATDFGNNTFCNIFFQNSNNEIVGLMGSAEATNGDRFLRMGVHKNDAWEWYSQVRNYWSDGISFWRSWTDGFLEQGSLFVTLGNNQTIGLLKPFNGTNYTILFGQSGGSSSASIGRSTWVSKQTNQFIANIMTPTNWYACGYAG